MSLLFAVLCVLLLVVLIPLTCVYFYRFLKSDDMDNLVEWTVILIVAFVIFSVGYTMENSNRWDQERLERQHQRIAK